MRLILLLIASLLLSLSAFAQTATKFEGQVVCCADCWAEADRTKVEFGTAEDLLKAQSCVANGDPTLLAVREGDKFTLHQLEQGRFRLSGKNWLEFIGKRVIVTGSLRQKKNVSVIRVDAFEVLSPSIAERDAAKMLGQEVELSLNDPFGNKQNLGALKGRIVVLNFWATYCTPCREEMPDLAVIQNEFAALGVQVVGASTDEPGDRAKVMQFVKETKVNFPIWMGATTADMIRFGLGGALPGTVVIDRNGRIARIISGVVNPADLKKQIERMLAGSDTQTAVASLPREKVVATSKAAEASAVPS